jgi:hypothetical protein
VGQNGCQSKKVWHILLISKWLTFDGILQLFSSNEHESGDLATFFKNLPPPRPNGPLSGPSLIFHHEGCL